ncbi:MAG: type II secretion system F family protein, partial [Oligoflexales bacterium]|nr:type II secretion system F family protein [Oligoflexales bacterium]
MPIYSYKGYDSQSGAVLKGKIEADSERTARQKLKQKQKIVIASIKEEKTDVAKAKRSFFAPKVSLNELSVMVRQFAVLQSAHVPLDESLKALISQVENPVLRNTLAAVKDSVSEGISLADSSAKFPGVFNRLYVNMVRAGESSGTLATVLQRLADFLEYQVKVGRQIISAVTYPAIMISTSTALVAYLFISVVPNLSKVFDSLHVTLPWYTQMLISISNSIKTYWYLIIGSFFAAYFVFTAWIAKEHGRKQFDAFLLGLPIFGSILL